MKRILSILSILIIVLSTLLFFTYKQMRLNHNESIRWENNYNESQKNVSRIQLTASEFKESLKEVNSKNDSLLKALKIKPKQVETIIKIHTIYAKTDTVTVNTVEDSSNTSSDIYLFDEKIDCLEINGFVEINSIDNPNIYITGIQYNNEINHIAYWERRQWRFLGIKTRLFGKKIGKVETVSRCGDVNLKQIDIIKKRK